MKKTILVYLLASFSFISCKEDDKIGSNSTDCDDDTVVEIEKHQVRGCYPVWNSSTYTANDVPYERLTHLHICFALPTAFGNLNTSEILNVDELVAKCHENNVKAILAIGGAAGSAEFDDLAENHERRAKFVQQIYDYVKEHEIDGIDIDWEHWPNAETVDMDRSNGLLNLMKDLHAKLNPENISITMDIFGSDWYGKHYLSDLENYVDNIVIMAFDGAGSWSTPGHHSPVSLSKSAVDYWNTRFSSEAKNKYIMGIPFYGYKFLTGHQAGDNAPAHQYKEVLAIDTNAVRQDTIIVADGVIYHHSRKTAEEKAKWVAEEGLAGTINWELTMDSDDSDKSQLTVLWENR